MNYFHSLQGTTLNTDFLCKFLQSSVLKRTDFIRFDYVMIFAAGYYSRER